MARISGLSGDDQTPVFVISVAADLAGMHAQTLRQYDRIGLVIPSRTRGGGRRYSAADVTRLREVQRLSQEEGVSLGAIQRIFDLEMQVEALRARVAELDDELDTAREALGQGRRFFAVGSQGDIVALRHGQRPRPRTGGQALVVWEPRARR
ncbi:heat-shock protein [Janibacter sp. Soil728]|uniref:heat shock protein transcriptional repressor HspR n=1 Tax=Janibacter sp. Soil728 TaxID=1736393 RepID=UPI0006F2035F|nr:MerR family transcriptional regulator [Janibacter sp. Soil728]KRE39354.1 heat-shock protein [Janibacter sp. Soil728]